MTHFPRLFAPLRVGSVELRNRVVVLPHGVSFDPGFGSAADRLMAYLVERARGGAGLVIRAGFVRPPSWERWGGWGGLLPLSELGGLNVCNDDGLLPHFRELNKRIVGEGAALFAQLAAGGRQIPEPGGHSYRVPYLAPSALPCPRTRQIPKEMEVEDIAEYVQAFGHAARNMREAGIAGVEVYAAHGYLLSEFLSPHVNRRADHYGGSLDNRMRFLVEIIAEIRRVVGRDFVVGVRLNGSDDAPGGLAIAGARAVARALAAGGAVDYLNVSGTTYLSWPAFIADNTAEPATFAAHAHALKQAAPQLPVGVGTRIATPAEAERILASGQADLIGLVRALIADPEWPAKAQRGEIEDIRHCTFVNQGCIMRRSHGRGLACLHNPAVGHEALLGIGTLRLSKRRKRVVVAGGGPAGMAAAGIAAERGHSVVLFESADDLGGQNRFAAAISSRLSLAEITRWQRRRLDRYAVEVRLGRQVHADEIVALRPDAVVVATGSVPLRSGYSSLRPDVAAVPGSDGANVATVWDIFRTPDRIGAKVALVDEDPHLGGIYSAEHLADLGRDVRVATPGLFAGQEVEASFVPALYARLHKKGLRIVPHLLLDRIEPGRVRFVHRYSGEPEWWDDIDTVVLAMGNRVEDGLRRELKGRVGELYAIGDCLAPRRIDDAILDGERVGRML